MNRISLEPSIIHRNVEKDVQTVSHYDFHPLDEDGLVPS